MGRVIDAATALLGTEDRGGRGEGALSAGALGTGLLVTGRATWSLASGKGNRTCERELLAGLPAL